MFKCNKVRDIAACQDCNFPQIIAVMSQLNSQGLEISKTEQKKRLDELETFKDSCVCGDPCPGEGFETRRALQCGDFVQSQ